MFKNVKWGKFDRAQKRVIAVYYDLCEDIDPKEARRHKRVIKARQEATRLYKELQRG